MARKLLKSRLSSILDTTDAEAAELLAFGTGKKAGGALSAPGKKIKKAPPAKSRILIEKKEKEDIPQAERLRFDALEASLKSFENIVFREKSN